MTERTGWPPGLLQDDCRKLARWFSSRPDARRIVRQVAYEHRMARLHERLFDPKHDHLFSADAAREAFKHIQVDGECDAIPDAIHHP